METTRLPASAKSSFIQLAADSLNAEAVNLVVEADLFTLSEVQVTWAALVDLQTKQPKKSAQIEKMKLSLRQVSAFRPPKAAVVAQPPEQKREAKPVPVAQPKPASKSKVTASQSAQTSHTSPQVVEELMSMGFNRSQTLKALSVSNNSADLAAHHLLNVSLYTLSSRVALIC